MKKTSRLRTPPARQRGALTLLVGLLLLAAATLLTLTVARTGVLESRIAANEQRAQEARQAAEAGLTHALSWLARNECTGFAEHFGEPNRPPPLELPGADGFGLQTYDLAVVLASTPACTPDSQMSCVNAQARSRHDPNVTASVRGCLRQERLLANPRGGAAPPLVVNGCISGIVGNPDVYPPACTATDPACDRNVVVSSRDTACLDTGHLGLNGGQVRPNAFATSAWEYVFGIDKARFRALASTRPETFRWIESTANWHESVGSPEQPVFMAFGAAAGCPKVNGSPVIYGIVYFEQACGNQGWGGADVFGSVVFEGDLEKLTAGSDFFHWNHWDLAGDEDDRGTLNPILGASLVPGAWRDW